MYEVFPIVAGIVSALVVQRLVASIQLRVVTLLCCGVAFGCMASLVSGELFVSPVFLAVDTALVLLSAVVTTVFSVAWRRHDRHAC